ncbi:uncharacterized protein BJ212DRAFT_1202065, partial [Suillus subaureus]
YPELLDDVRGFYFNSYIAEQTNVWFGSFHNICQESEMRRWTLVMPSIVFL